jgi:hypothetical protein
MEGSSQFSVPHEDSDALTFVPLTKLPDHLERRLELARDLRNQMTPVMKAILELMDKSTLRSAARPQSD